MTTFSSSSGDDRGSPSCPLRPGAAINEGDGPRESVGDGRGATFLVRSARTVRIRNRE